jgi:DNA-binding response OmpR family regulator
MTSDAIAELDLEETAVGLPPRILVVDDDHHQADILRFRLAQQGYRVTTAHSIADARELAFSELPSAVLLDVRLPDGDGLDLAKELGEGRLTSGIPVIFVSGIEKSDIIRQSRAAGGSYYLCKPYDPNVLLLVLEHALGRSAGW